ncbi:MAG: ankyrin repeat domain-containing protein [Bacteroidetes bacterium]|nr:ankyrin repeat domain-containing protein [Bacteroidota bacterium]
MEVVRRNPELIDTSESIHGNTLLQLAVTCHSSTRVLDELLRRGASLYATDHSGSDAFVASIIFSNSDALALLLDTAERRHDSLQISELLILAVRQRSLGCVNTLIHAGANVNFLGSLFELGTPLWTAIAYPCAPIAEQLLISGADPNAKCNLLGDTPLEYSCREGHEGLSRLLLEHGADVNGTQHPIRLPLAEAIGNGSDSLIMLLLRHGAQINPAVPFANSPLAVALVSDNLPRASLLISKGATIPLVLQKDSIALNMFMNKLSIAARTYTQHYLQTLPH